MESDLVVSFMVTGESDMVVELNASCADGSMNETALLVSSRGRGGPLSSPSGYVCASSKYLACDEDGVISPRLVDTKDGNDYLIVILSNISTASRNGKDGDMFLISLVSEEEEHLECNDALLETVDKFGDAPTFYDALPSGSGVGRANPRRICEYARGFTEKI